MTRAKAFLILFLVVAISTFSVFNVSKLKFDYDFEAFFPQNDSETDFYLQFRKDFESDNDFIIVALENVNGIFDFEFLKKVDDLANDLRSLEEIEEVITITQLKETVRDPFLGSVFTKPMFRWEQPENYPIDSLKLFQTQGLKGLFFSEDGRSLTINLKHTEGLSKAKGDMLSQQVQDLVNAYDFEGAHLVGRTIGQRMYVEMMIQELLMFISISLLITIVFLFVAFRSGWGVVIPTLIVLISILWTLGFMKIIGKDIDLMITVLPTIIFVVGMSDSVHVLTKYLQELRNGRDKNEAIKYAFKSIRLATFLTALTTSIGFLTLVLSNIKPISDFGIYISVGVMLAYGLTFSMLPALLFLGKPKRLITFSTSDDFWTKKLSYAFRWVLRNRNKLFLGGFAITFIGLYGLSILKVDNVILEDLKDDHVLKQEFQYFEQHYAGARPFEMAVVLNENTEVFNEATLTALDEIDNFLLNEYGVGSLMSFPILIKSANKSLNGGSDDYYSIPSGSRLRMVKKALNNAEIKEVSSLFFNPEKKILRVSGKVGDIGRKHYESLNERLDNFIEEKKYSKLFTVKVTGTAHLIDLNNKYLVENMVLDLMLSVMAIGLIMSIIYKSWKMFFLTVIPNVIPLILVGGIMGFAGIPIKVSTSIIFNIAFGIAVDDTIHFLARVRTLLAEGYNVQYAVKRTFLTTGKAMIITTLILCGGFMTLIFSNFLGTFYIGLLITTTLIIGVITELIFAPLVILFFFKKKTTSKI